MSAHDWPEFDEEVDRPANKMIIWNGEWREFALIDKSQYNYAKVRIDACADFENESLQLIAESGGFAQMQVEYIDNVAGLRTQRDALQQRCEELVSALIELDDSYCSVHSGLTKDERFEHRKTLIKVRQLIAKHKEKL